MNTIALDHHVHVVSGHVLGAANVVWWTDDGNRKLCEWSIVRSKREAGLHDCHNR